MRAGNCRELNLGQQALALNDAVPGGRTWLRPGQLTWSGVVQPTETTQRYRLRIRLRQGSTPSVRVSAPELKPTVDGLLPHVFCDGSLCLSSSGDWDSSMYISSTHLPWACEWLTFYELWRVCGLWHGDGPNCLDRAWQESILHPYN